jgi:pyruvyl transferase EpsO
VDAADMPHPTPADLVLLDQMRGTLHAELRRALRGRTEAVLLDVPLHGNAGDLLIVEGLLRSLAELGVRLALLQDWRLTSWQRLRRIPRSTAVLLMGGGNFGGLYPAHDEYRAQVLRAVPADQVVILPQSVSLSSNAQADAVRELYGDHPEAVFLIRDRLSAARLADAVPSLAHSIRHTPDLAFGARLEARDAPSVDIRVVKRDDQESLHGALLDLPQRARVLSSDWPSFDGDSAEFRDLTDFVRRRRRVLSTAVRAARPVHLQGLAEAIVERSWIPRQQRLLRGHTAVSVESLQRTLEQGRVIVTDRLHAHLGASLLGIPNIVLRSLDGKGHALIDDWTAPLSTTFVADGPGEATRIAERILTNVAAPD